MKILHISNGYAGSKVHSQLTKALDTLGIAQTVYCPVREKRLLNQNRFDGKDIKFVYSLCIKPWYKYVYHYKAQELYKDMKQLVNVKSADIIHAHTLFSDGVLAYKAHKEYGTPYVIAVRNTDVNGFVRLMKHTYGVGRRIILNAEKIYFISASLKVSFEHSNFIRPILDKVKYKFVVRPNGMDDYWHNHISNESRTGHDVLYVGDYSANKNVVRLAEAVLELRKEKGFENVRLVIVGGDVKGGARKNDGRTQTMIDAHPEAIKAYGIIQDKDRLKKVMRRCSLLAMTSIHETFGLVYLEALSQNLPVVYTKGQGIDGLFDGTVGIGVSPLSSLEIKNAIKEVFQNHVYYGNRRIDFLNFKWSKIAESYVRDYNDVVIS